MSTTPAPIDNPDADMERIEELMSQLVIVLDTPITRIDATARLHSLDLVKSASWDATYGRSHDAAA